MLVRRERTRSARGSEARRCKAMAPLVEQLEHREMLSTIIIKLPDLAVTSPTWNTAQGVDFSYTISGANLASAAQVGLYWSQDDKFTLTGTHADTLVGGLQPTKTVQGTYPISVTRAQLNRQPATARFLLAVIDPNNTIAERDERHGIMGSNNVRPLSISTDADIKVYSATTADSKSVTFDYEVTGSVQVDFFQVGVYRSDDNRFDKKDLDYPSGAYFAVTDTSPGRHTITIPNVNLVIDPTHKYVFVVADPYDQIFESDSNPFTEDNTSFFRKWTMAFVTHGLAPLGILQDLGWMDSMTQALLSNNPGIDFSAKGGYDFAYTFDWSSTSNDWAFGRTIDAGKRLGSEIYLKSLNPAIGPNDVIDLHLIGHSRGAVVIDQALLELERTGRTRALKGGYVRMTMLDPHPANNGYGGRYSVNFASRVGFAAVLVESAFNAIAQDPMIQVPSWVHLSQSVYQNTTWQHARGLSDRLVINLWGMSNIPGLANQVDLTLRVPGVSHTTITEWYEYILRGKYWR